MWSLSSYFMSITLWEPNHVHMAILIPYSTIFAYIYRVLQHILDGCSMFLKINCMAVVGFAKLIKWLHSISQKILDQI